MINNSYLKDGLWQYGAMEFIILIQEFRHRDGYNCGCEVFFHPRYIEPELFYSTVSRDFLISLTKMQINVCREISKSTGLRLFFNIEPDAICECYDDIIKTTNTECDIIFEVTERTCSNSNETLQVIKSLYENGVVFCVDDFSVNYEGVATKSLIDDCFEFVKLVAPKDFTNSKLWNDLFHLIKLAKAWNKLVIVENVATRFMHRLLENKSNADAFQGYYIHRPQIISNYRQRLILPKQLMHLQIHAPH
ncbi:EAL domain-containing protein [Aeromonas caviae]|jgi:EAL domain-containing protein (putative c-di-GMP-specific phosphodiesterase class I)|uniref:EAL domain-containing protein n=1 Tax=Aeromonas caviae TaxID=648 RepID=UPI0009BAFB38|nr:EAL domain-containing protein [Aeromonas caviae]ATP90915.1 hypothetical protein VI35_12535 [Aeromonas caviae]